MARIGLAVGVGLLGAALATGWGLQQVAPGPEAGPDGLLVTVRRDRLRLRRRLPPARPRVRTAPGDGGRGPPARRLGAPGHRRPVPPRRPGPLCRPAGWVPAAGRRLRRGRRAEL